jgi:flavin-dependent dehydrogenase
MLGTTIVGGSVAGCFLAYLLARKGQPVRLLERQGRLRPTPRTLIVTSSMLDLLGSLGKKAVVNEINRFELFADGVSTSVPLRRPDLIIDRAEITRLLAEEAQKAGADIRLGASLVDLEPREDGVVTVVAANGAARQEMASRTVIGADGAFSKVARLAGWPQQPTVPLVQAVVPLPRDLPVDTTRVWFVPQDTPYFYWLVPENEERGVLGLIGEDGPRTRECLERFLDRQGLRAIEYQGGRIPKYERWIPSHRKLGGGDVYLVGDAAGQVKVTTVGGIVTGLRGALGVAEAVMNGGSSKELRRLRRELGLHLLIRKSLHHFTEADYRRVLTLLSGSARRSLSIHTRDEMPALLRNLLLRQPRLLPLGLRGLLMNGRGHS